MTRSYIIKATEDEYVEVLNLIDKMREEKARQQAIIEQEQQIGAAVATSISVIGLEETKRIVRNAARDLRKIEDDNHSFEF